MRSRSVTIGVDQHAGDPVDVGEQERGALILGDVELGGVRDALRQGLAPDVPEPRVPDPVRAQQHRERDPAAHHPAHELGRVGRDDKRVAGRAQLEQPQDLVDVALDAGSRLLAQVVVARGELGHVRDHMSVRPRASSGARGRSSAASPRTAGGCRPCWASSAPGDARALISSRSYSTASPRAIAGVVESLSVACTRARTVAATHVRRSWT